MFTVAWLSTSVKDSKWNPYPGWRKLASDINFRPLWVDPARSVPMEDPFDFVRKADAFYLSNRSLLGHDELCDEIAAQISSGKRLLAELNPGTQESLDAMNLFLRRYDIQGSIIGIRRRNEAVPNIPGQHGGACAFDQQP